MDLLCSCRGVQLDVLVVEREIHPIESKWAWADLVLDPGHRCLAD